MTAALNLSPGGCCCDKVAGELFDVYGRWQEVTGAAIGVPYPTPHGLVRYPSIHPGMEVSVSPPVNLGVWFNSKHSSVVDWLVAPSDTTYDSKANYTASPYSLIQSAVMGNDQNELLWVFEYRNGTPFAVLYDPIAKTELYSIVIPGGLPVSSMTSLSVRAGSIADDRPSAVINWRTAVSPDQWQTIELFPNWINYGPTSSLPFTPAQPSGIYPPANGQSGRSISISPTAGVVDSPAIPYWFEDLDTINGGATVGRIDAVAPRSWPICAASKTKLESIGFGDPLFEARFTVELLVGPAEFNDSPRSLSIRGLTSDGSLALFHLLGSAGGQSLLASDGQNFRLAGQTVFQEISSVFLPSQTTGFELSEPKCRWLSFDYNGGHWIGEFEYLRFFGTPPNQGQENHKVLMCDTGEIERDYSYSIKSVHAIHDGQGFIVIRSTTDPQKPWQAVSHSPGGGVRWSSQPVVSVNCEYSSDRWVYFTGQFDNGDFPGQVYQWGDLQEKPKVWLVKPDGSQSSPGGALSTTASTVGRYPESPFVPLNTQIEQLLQTRKHEVVRRSDAVGGSVPADANDFVGALQTIKGG